MTQRLIGHVALITGACRGIGRATALALTKEGADIVITDLRESELKELAQEITAAGVQVLAVPADVSQEEDVTQLKAKALEIFNRVDILVNNVGVGKFGPLPTLTVQDYDWMMNTNMRSSFLCTSAFLPGMLARKQGWVVFVASVSGLRGVPSESVYCATKFAQVGFAQALDYETREHGVKVSVVAPGGVKTSFYADHKGDPMLENKMDAEDIAEAVIFAVTQPPKARVFLVGLRPMSEPL